MKNYYEILEVNDKASLDIIKKVFKIQIKKYHPDTATADKKEFAENKVKELNEAYEVLADEVKRREYDELLKTEKENTLNYNNNLLAEIENLKQKLIIKEQIIEHFLGHLDLSEYETLAAENDLDYDENNFNSNKINYEKDESITNYYLNIFKSCVLKILVFCIFLIIIFGIISIITQTNIFGILINVFFN